MDTSCIFIPFCPRAGLSLQTHHSPLYPLLILPFRIFIQFIYYNVVVSSDIIFCREPSRASFSRQFLLSQWPSQFLFLFFISSSINLFFLLPLFLAQLHFLFCLSILHAPSFSIFTSQMLPIVFAHSVVVSKSLHQSTLHSTESTLLP